MDQNIKMVYVNETQSIVIEKDGYTIVKSSNAVVEADKSSNAAVEAISVSAAVASLEAEPKEEPINEKEEAILDASTVCY